jgi:hypothetical protein
MREWRGDYGRMDTRRSITLSDVDQRMIMLPGSRDSPYGLV